MPSVSSGFTAPTRTQQISAFSKDSSITRSEYKYITNLKASTIVETPESNTFDQVDSDISAETEQKKVVKTYLDDGFVFGLEGSGLERPKGKQSMVVVEGDSLETTPYQVGIVSVTMASHIAFLGYAFQQSLAYHGGDVGTTIAASLATIISSWLLADLGSGILHWSVDNYGNGKTPIMGSIIAAFQGHHSAQWTITERGFCNNVHKLCVPFGIPTVALFNFISSPQVSIFFTIFCMLEILSQEFHKWSHMSKKEVPAYVNALQEYGLTINRTCHAQHHISPHAGNYCIVSGACNKILDETFFFRRLERFIYERNGVESNAWKLDAKLRERTLRGEYNLV